MAMNEAIKLAIGKGGYIPSATDYGKPIDWISLFQKPEKGWRGFEYLGAFGKEAKMEAVLNPLFWQALDKALGWPYELYGHCGKNPDDYEDKEKTDCCIYGIEEMEWFVKAWLYHALRYHEIALTGGDTEAYWKELLK
jgi:hypothetical protein